MKKKRSGTVWKFSSKSATHSKYAHSRNVMHCDLKPANIMIGEYHEAYIMDWGIAHAIQPEESKRTLAGTPQYLSPEAILGESCDQRADIFAMGAILFETVMLKPAFTGETAEEVMANIRDGAMEPETHRFGTRVSRDLKAIIRKALAADPACRYQQIGELSADLRRCLMGLEVERQARQSTPESNPLEQKSLAYHADPAARRITDRRRGALLFALSELPFLGGNETERLCAGYGVFDLLPRGISAQRTVPETGTDDFPARRRCPVPAGT